MEEEFICKVKFKEGAIDNLEVLEGDEKKCRELFKNTELKFLKKENVIET